MCELPLGLHWRSENRRGRGGDADVSDRCGEDSHPKNLTSRASGQSGGVQGRSYQTPHHFRGSQAWAWACDRQLVWKECPTPPFAAAFAARGVDEVAPRGAWGGTVQTALPPDRKRHNRVE